MYNIKLSQADLSSSHCSNSASFLQSAFWCSFKARHGWKFLQFDLQYSPSLLDVASSSEKHEQGGQSPQQKGLPIDGSINTIKNTSCGGSSAGEFCTTAGGGSSPSSFCNSKVANQDSAPIASDAHSQKAGTDAAQYSADKNFASSGATQQDSACNVGGGESSTKVTDDTVPLDGGVNLSTQAASNGGKIALGERATIAKVTSNDTSSASKNEFASTNFASQKKGDLSKECIAPNGNDCFCGTMAVLVRTFAHGFFSIAYIPLFPRLDGAGSNSAVVLAHLLTEIAFSLRRFLPKNTICVRFDPSVDFPSPDKRDEFVRSVSLVSFADKLPLAKNSTDIQPPDTTIIDLTQDEAALLSKMKSKWRYNINLSKRKGVLIEKVGGNDPNLSTKLDIFYSIYQITAARDGIALHSKEYYKDLLVAGAAEGAPKVTLYLAKHEDDYLAGIITIFCNSGGCTEAVYLYGASSDKKRNLMPNFLLQWTAMTDAKLYGSTAYDLYGMPPTNDEHHPMHGLYLFKTGFCGRNTHRAGSFDVRLRFIYKTLTFAEKARAFYHKKFLKKIRGR